MFVKCRIDHVVPDGKFKVVSQKARYSVLQGLMLCVCVCGLGCGGENSFTKSYFTHLSLIKGGKKKTRLKYAIRELRRVKSEEVSHMEPPLSSPYRVGLCCCPSFTICNNTHEV